MKTKAGDKKKKTTKTVDGTDEGEIEPIQIQLRAGTTATKFIFNVIRMTGSFPFLSISIYFGGYCCSRTIFDILQAHVQWLVGDQHVSFIGRIAKQRCESLHRDSSAFELRMWMFTCTNKKIAHTINAEFVHIDSFCGDGKCDILFLLVFHLFKIRFKSPLNLHCLEHFTKHLFTIHWDFQCNLLFGFMLQIPWARNRSFRLNLSGVIKVAVKVTLLIPSLIPFR